MLATSHPDVARCSGLVGQSIAWFRDHHIRCNRRGRFEFDGKQYCRLHLPRREPLEADVYEDEIILCACGCGEPTNMWGALFRSLARDGLTHAEIARRYDFDRAYVSKVIRDPPRVVKGHSGRIYWASPAGVRKREEYAVRLERHWGKVERRRAIRLSKKTWRQSPAARAKTEHETKKRRRERIQRRNIALAVSLDSVFLPEGTVEGVSLHDAVPGGDDALSILLREQDALTLRKIVGDMGPDDVARLSAWDLSRLQDRLRDAGFLPSSVQQRERVRLRLPEVHTGAAAKTGSSRGGRRNRAQQQQVTQDHKVRSLPQAARQSHAHLRTAKKQSHQPPQEPA